MGNYLVSAKDSINFLKSNGKSDAVVLFASMPFVLVQSAFALNVKLLPLDRSDLLSSQIDFSDTWVIQKSYGGGEGHRVYLEPPLADAGKTLKDGELPVFRRTFYGMDRRENLEISQKLVHALGVFWIDHRSAFCRLDENGDLEDVISILSEVGSDLHDRREAVLISAKDLAEYLALSDSSLVHRFDFTRVDTASFSHWGNPERSSKGTDELAYNLGVGAGNGSWANGYQVVRPSITVDDLIAEFEEETSGRKSVFTHPLAARADR